MRTNRFFLTGLLLIGMIAYINANEKKVIHSKLEEATVFYRGAELKHSASAILSKGANELLIEGLSPDIDPNSIKIKTTGGTIVSSYEFVEETILKNDMELIRKRTQDSVNSYQNKIKLINIETKVNKEMLELFEKSITQKILSSQNDSVRNKMSIDELVKSIDFLKTRSIETETLLMNKNNDKERFETEINRLNGQLVSIHDEQETIKRLKLNVTAPESKTSQFTISYCTYSAGWTPFYNINVVSIDQPIQIISKAKVFQTTGVDWQQVKLTLSSGTPGNGKIAPLFHAWFLQNRQAAIRTQNHLDIAQNAYIYSESQDQELRKETSMAQNTLDEYLTVNDNLLMVTYQIDLPYTIPGDGNEQSIDLRTQKTQAAYHFYCAPKLDPESYLLAEVKDSEKLDLPRGNAQITYDGMYIGETVIDGASTLKELILTLGTDKRVSVKREQLHNFSSTKLLGSDIKQVFTYKITVKNNQNKTIKMVLKDQYPISTQKGIEVELLKDTTKPTFDKTETGVVTWEDTFTPGETKTYQISYSVKYPKDMNLNL